MISSATLTYSRYQQRNALTQSRAFNMPVEENTSVGKTAEAPALRTGVLSAYDSAMPTTADDAQMRNLVERLNHRINPESSELSFRMDTKGRNAKIIMMAGSKVQGSYSREEVPVLESYLHEMAGMHLSVLT